MAKVARGNVIQKSFQRKLLCKQFCDENINSRNVVSIFQQEASPLNLNQQSNLVSCESCIHELNEFFTERHESFASTCVIGFQIVFNCLRESLRMTSTKEVWSFGIYRASQGLSAYFGFSKGFFSWEMSFFVGGNKSRSTCGNFPRAKYSLCEKRNLENLGDVIISIFDEWWKKRVFVSQ